MRTWLRSVIEGTLPAELAASRFECSWCQLSFDERPTACPECRGMVVRVVVQ